MIHYQVSFYHHSFIWFVSVCVGMYVTALIMTIMMMIVGTSIANNKEKTN